MLIYEWVYTKALEGSHVWELLQQAYRIFNLTNVILGGRDFWLWFAIKSLGILYEMDEQRRCIDIVKNRTGTKKHTPIKWECNSRSRLSFYEINYG